MYGTITKPRYTGTARRYPGARHEILNETNRDEVMDDIVEWLDERLAVRTA